MIYLENIRKLIFFFKVVNYEYVYRLILQLSYGAGILVIVMPILLLMEFESSLLILQKSMLRLNWVFINPDSP